MSLFTNLLTLIFIAFNCCGERQVDRNPFVKYKEFTWQEMATIVRTHNDLRRAVKPEATDMEFMTWHDELADMAREWTNNCVYMYGQPDRLNPPFRHIGQNIWQTTVTCYDTDSSCDANPSWPPGKCNDDVYGDEFRRKCPLMCGLCENKYSVKDVVMEWYNQSKDYTYFPRHCKNECDHYTQLVWKSSYKIGCGITDCADSLLGNNSIIFLTCYYGPGGNYIGESPYSDGKPCSSCPPRQPFCDDKLCSTPTVCDNIACANGAKLENKSCVCMCSDIWTGVICDKISYDLNKGMTLQPLVNHIIAAILTAFYVYSNNK